MDLLRNGSGYVDITAYKAIKNVERNMNMANCKRGEIFEVRMNNSDETRKALVISADFRIGRTFQSVVFLCDEQEQEDWVPVVCRGMMYADCSKISYVDAKRLYSFIRTATENEMAAVQKEAEIYKNLYNQLLEKLIGTK